MVFKEGLMFKMTRRVVHKGVKYGLKKFCVVEEDTGDGLIMVSFTCQLKSVHSTNVSMTSHKGFKFCRWVEKSILIGNCERV